MERSVVGINRALDIPETPGDYTTKSLRIIKDLLQRAIDQCVNLTDLVKGNRVLIKPNLVRPSRTNPFAIVTDERVIMALVELLRDAGAREIWLGDNPGWGLSLSDALAETEGLAERLASRGVELCLFDREPVVQIDNPEAVLFDSIALPRRVIDADVYINLPKMKTHMHTLVTLGIKNQYGLVSDQQRMHFHRNDINLKIVDILRVLRPHLTVVDGIMAVQGQAPISGSVIPDMNTVVCGQDVAAVDAVSAAVMGIDPMEVTMLRLVRQYGLGTVDLEDIDLRGMALENVRRTFKRPVLSSMGAYPQIHCVEGGACFGCLSALRHALDKLHAEGRLRGRPVHSVYVGMPMPNFRNLKRHPGDLWCFGNCALPLAYDQVHFGRTANMLPGCPPHILDFYKAYVAVYGDHG